MFGAVAVMGGHLPAARVGVVRFGQMGQQDVFGAAAQHQVRAQVPVVHPEPVEARLRKQAGGRLGGFVTGPADVEEAFALFEQRQHFFIEPPRQQHRAIDAQQRVGVEVGRADRPDVQIAVIGQYGKLGHVLAVGTRDWKRFFKRMRSFLFSRHRSQGLVHHHGLRGAARPESKRVGRNARSSSQYPSQYPRV